MAKVSIDEFPFLKQWKAENAPVYPYRDALAISADYRYEPWRLFAEGHDHFLREIKEDI